MDAISLFLPPWDTVVQPPKESTTLRKTVAWIRDLGDVEKDRLFLRSTAAAAVCYSAILISLIDAVSYAVRTPVRCLSEVIALDLKQALYEMARGVANVVGSLKLTALLVVCSVLGTLFPYHVFPWLPNTRDVARELEKDIEGLEKRKRLLEGQLDGVNKALEGVEEKHKRLVEEKGKLEPVVSGLQGKKDELAKVEQELVKKTEKKVALEKLIEGQIHLNKKLEEEIAKKQPKSPEK